MAVYHTVDGQPYSVTAGTDVTVTDADGLILGVSAGGQGSFVGNGGDVTITGEHHFVQIKGGGGGGGNGGGGGGGEPFDGNLDADLHVGTVGGPIRKIYLNGVELDVRNTPVPETLPSDNVLKHGRVYVIEVTEDTDFSAITVEEYATAELWIDYTAGSVTTSSDWSWIDGIDLPATMVAGTRYMLVLRNTGNALLVKLDCSYKDVND